MPKPDLNRVPSFYHAYINMVKEDELSKAFESHPVSLYKAIKGLSEEKWNYRYAENKWTIKELVQHIIDGERIFAYRALCFARKDATPLPGFDENLYAESSNANNREPTSLLEELQVVQKSSALLFRTFDEDQLEAKGVANNNPIYVRAIGFIIIGHALHHLKILEERYLLKNPALPGSHYKLASP
jgi:hypothetical protein